ncbi:MAG: small multi-drug export protein [Clostridia bacterium]|nr:small multi-drug export protein [Clostridia bacterium]
MNSIIEFFADNFSSCIWLAVILVAMIPTLESKIAIPLGMNTAIWGNCALSPFSAFLCAFVGSIIPCYVIMILTRKLKKHTAIILHSRFFQKYAIKGAQIEGKNDFHKYMALTGFVAVPIPLTGVWAGSLISGLSNLKLHYSFISITIGAFISAGTIALLCHLFSNSISYIFMLSLAIIIIFLFIDLLLNMLKSRKKSGV